MIDVSVHRAGVRTKQHFSLTKLLVIKYRQKQTNYATLALRFLWAGHCLQANELLVYWQHVKIQHVKFKGEVFWVFLHIHIWGSTALLWWTVQSWELRAAPQLFLASGDVSNKLQLSDWTFDWICKWAFRQTQSLLKLSWSGSQLLLVCGSLPVLTVLPGLSSIHRPPLMTSQKYSKWKGRSPGTWHLPSAPGLTQGATNQDGLNVENKFQFALWACEKNKDEVRLSIHTYMHCFDG